MNNKKKNIFRIAAIIISSVFIIYGFIRGENNIVLNKAINICLECIGLG